MLSQQLARFCIMLMASRGRGRGQASERKNGSKKSLQTPKSINELAEYLHSLNEDNLDIHGTDFADMVHRFADTESKLSKTVDLIFDTTVNSRDYSSLGSDVCRFIIQKECEGGSTGTFGSDFLRKLLQRFQSDVTCMKDIRKKSIEHWLGIFAFLCDVYHKVKVSDKPILIVGKAILRNIDSMVNDANVIDDEIDTVCTKLKTCGKLLEEQDPDFLENIIDNLRKLVINRKSSCQRRCFIMELIELKQLGWVDHSGRLDKFYVDALADAIVEDEAGENS